MAVNANHSVPGTGTLGGGGGGGGGGGEPTTLARIVNWRDCARPCVSEALVPRPSKTMVSVIIRQTLEEVLSIAGCLLCV